jgi:hypothetical protein
MPKIQKSLDSVFREFHIRFNGIQQAKLVGVNILPENNLHLFVWRRD